MTVLMWLCTAYTAVHAAPRKGNDITATLLSWVSAGVQSADARTAQQHTRSAKVHAQLTYNLHLERMQCLCQIRPGGPSLALSQKQSIVMRHPQGGTPAADLKDGRDDAQGSAGARM